MAVKAQLLLVGKALLRGLRAAREAELPGAQLGPLQWVLQPGMRGLELAVGKVERRGWWRGWRWGGLGVRRRQVGMRALRSLEAGGAGG